MNHIAQLLPEFTKLHPDIEVRIQQLPWTAAHQKLLTAFAGEATPVPRSTSRMAADSIAEPRAML